jgi:hypothetical protein
MAVWGRLIRDICQNLIQWAIIMIKKLLEKIPSYDKLAMRDAGGYSRCRF